MRSAQLVKGSLQVLKVTLCVYNVINWSSYEWQVNLKAMQVYE